jgi:hypothetical protein
LGRHGPKKTRHGLGPGWITVFTFRADTARPKNLLGFDGPNPFGTKHDGLGPIWPGLAQFPALVARLRVAVYIVLLIRARYSIALLLCGGGLHE